MASPNVVDKRRVTRSMSAYCGAPSPTILKGLEKAYPAFVVWGVVAIMFAFNSQICTQDSAAGHVLSPLAA